ncbi:hypothetical protein Leryth_023957, partial [Lithospermum erythrorhizon]
YDSHLDNPFIQEYVLAKIEGDLLGIRTLGWEPLLDIAPKFSRNKVCEFYANIVNKQKRVTNVVLKLWLMGCA